MLEKVIGVVHLLPLPGSAKYCGDFSQIKKQAIEECELYRNFGINRIIVENAGDGPFFPHSVPKITTASMSAICQKISDEFDLKIGIGTLRNDAISSLSTAYAVGGYMIRVNVLCGNSYTPQGEIEGRAYDVLRLKSSLKSDVKIYGDVNVKYSTPLTYRNKFEEEVRDVSKVADSIVLTGNASGSPTSQNQIEIALKHSKVPVVIGSGVDEYNIQEYVKMGCEVIVGSRFRIDNDISKGLDKTSISKVLAKLQ